MRSIKISSLVLVLAALAAAAVPLTVSASPTQPQTNLLKNASFEEGFTGGVANSWSKWTISDAAATPQNNCGRKEPTYQQITSSLDARRVKDGSSAQQMLTPVQDPGFGFYGGLQQTVAGLTPGKTYRFSVWVHAWSSTKDNPALSESTGPAYFEVGVGQGPTFAADPNVKHSGIKDIKDNYVQLSQDLTATGNTITVFIYANPSACSKHNEAFFDAASLTEVTGSGTAAPTTAPGATKAPPTATLRVLATKFPTPTPNAEGKIVYTVQAGDTIIDICGVIGRGTDITCIDDILKLNGLSNARDIRVGQQLVIGTTGVVVQPTATTLPTEVPTTAPTTDPNASPTTAPQPTTIDQPTVDPNASPTSALNVIPTEVAVGGEGSICVTLYNDANGNGILDQGEGLVAGGNFSLLDLTASTTLQTYTTDGASEPHCFEGLNSGNYRVTSTLPEGFKATTRADWDLPLSAASSATLEFGAQSTGGTTSGGDTGGATTNTDSGRLTRALLAGAGVVLLLIAAGVAGFLVLTRRR
ncbi:MAG: LysM peptidoglycan-binding domain-containing protein [Chloroflexi bacterium]|nr:LysM peptidoglycan-binding domain-containing protein [Chloroflexota bacterium]